MLSTKTEVVSTAKGKPSQVSKAAVSTSQAKPPQAPKPAAKPPAPAPKDDVTGSVKQTAKTQKPAPVPQARSAEVSGQLAKVEDEPEEWVEVSLAARVHRAPSVSAPTVRFYRVGTRLKALGRDSGWIKVADPTTFKEGWIYEKYLTPKEGPDQKRSALSESKLPDDPAMEPADALPST